MIENLIKDVLQTSQKVTQFVENLNVEIEKQLNSANLTDEEKEAIRKEVESANLSEQIKQLQEKAAKIRAKL